MYHRFTFDKLDWFWKLNNFQMHQIGSHPFENVWQILIYGNLLMRLYIIPQHVFAS